MHLWSSVRCVRPRRVRVTRARVVKGARTYVGASAIVFRGSVLIVEGQLALVDAVEAPRRRSGGRRRVCYFAFGRRRVVELDAACEAACRI